jgi:hypothetical protein
MNQENAPSGLEDLSDLRDSASTDSRKKRRRKKVYPDSVRGYESALDRTAFQCLRCGEMTPIIPASQIDRSS